ncbi:DUF3006 domain-containing protein [Halalkalibacillus halophilus]|uniref:DUF3006 domain-containing protein n=1 Tax=Halalkalibacillus halophilus TaxID=392827 RepID=UPI0003F59AC9|nr:DUF3006 domain-containing protein [Halalkalibacillus halophilus]
MERKHGVIDRVEDNMKAVILIEEEEKELIVPSEQLPPEHKEGDWLVVTFENDRPTKYEINYEKTKEAKSSTADRLSRLRKKSSGSKFNRKK